MPTPPSFTLELADDGVAQLTLSRPERLNTMDPAFFRDFRDAVERLDAEGRTRVLGCVSTGRHCSSRLPLCVLLAGLGLPRASSARARLGFQDGLRRLMRCFDVLEEARFPVVCAVQGGCIGGALDLAVACDIRLCTADAFFTVQEIHIGMAADLGVLQRLPRLVPPGVARQMAYTGERVGAERALAVGLVNEVAPDADTLAQRALALAREIAAKSPLAVAGSKRALNYARDHGVAESMAQMTLLQSAIFDLDEMARAIRAWQAKGTAEFEPLKPLERS